LLRLFKYIERGLLLIILTISIISCSIFEKGYYDKNNQYVPKNPKFKLKDKSNNIIPANLDTINTYRLHYVYYDGLETYPNDSYSSPSSTPNELTKYNEYLKFYIKGRCSSFLKPLRDSLGSPYLINNLDMKPNSSYSKNYYYSEDGNSIDIETFVYGLGYGRYLKFKYILKETGDTITQVYNNTVSIYVKEILPPEWKQYPTDW